MSETPNPFGRFNFPRIVMPTVPNIAAMTKIAMPTITSPAMDKVIASLRTPVFDEAFGRMGAQFWAGTRISETARKIAEKLTPQNWRGTGLFLDQAMDLAREEGLCLIAAPRSDIVKSMVKAKDAQHRTVILARRRKAIMDDCLAVLESLSQADLDEYKFFAERAARALKAGHEEAAQALAANLLDTMLTTLVEPMDADLFRQVKRRQGDVDFDWCTVKWALLSGAIWCAHVHYRPSQGDAIPSQFARHASAHGVSEQQYTQANAVTSVMLVTSTLFTYATSKP